MGDGSGRMILLLDIDGVLETSPAWRTPELLDDGFYKFNPRAQEHLIRIVDTLQPEIVLTTTHRITYDLAAWKRILETRGIRIVKLSKVNDAATITDIKARNLEIEEWFSRNAAEDFLILDDDRSLHDLPLELKRRWIRIDPMVGISEEDKLRVLSMSNRFD